MTYFCFFVLMPTNVDFVNNLKRSFSANLFNDTFQNNVCRDIHLIEAQRW